MTSLLEAALEKKERRTIRRSLTKWCRYTGFEPAAHHRLLIDKLEQVSTGDIDRLAVFMPPGAAKSTYGSILYAPWHFAQHPDHCIIAASHTAELAEKWGRRVRNLLAEHSLVLGVSLSADSQAAGRWETNSGESISLQVSGALSPDDEQTLWLLTIQLDPERTQTVNLSATRLGIGTSQTCTLALSPAEGSC
jgi:hypothetical protein